MSLSRDHFSFDRRNDEMFVGFLSKDPESFVLLTTFLEDYAGALQIVDMIADLADTLAAMEQTFPEIPDKGKPEAAAEILFYGCCLRGLVYGVKKGFEIAQGGSSLVN